MFTHFFIKRPVFASVCSLLIIILGMVGFTRLPVQEYPKIDPPIVTVTTSYPGASPQVVETEVTEILEAQINGIAGIKTLTSSSREGSSSISVQFQLNRDLEVAAQEVRSRVARGAGRLPDDVDIPVVEKRSGDDERILWIAFFSQTLSTLELSNYADLYIKNSLETVDGVNSVSISGERRYAMRLWLDTLKMAARQITALDVEQALRRQNIEIPSGRIEGKETEYPVRTLGRLETPQDYEDLIIKRNDNGSQVKIRDIGRAEIGAKDDRVIARFNGNPAVGLGISKLADANLIEVAHGIKAKLAELKKSFPEGLSYEIAVDYSEFVELAIEEVWISLLISIGLVVLIIFLFLRNWRATLIPAITIPISLIGAFSVMFFMGFSINTLTLFALTLATGLVVDDTIVVLENIIRYMEEKRLDAFPATYAAVGEVVFAVIATTVVLVAVFVPVAFAGGTSGRLFNEFALTLAASVVFSSIVALTLAPPLSARLLRHETKPQGLMKILSFPLDLFEWVLNKTTAIYGWTLRLLMATKPVVILGFIASLGLTVWLFLQLPQGFLPSEDRGRIFTPITAPEGVSINYTNRVVKQVENIFSQVSEITSYFAIAGSSRGASQANTGFSFARLKPWSERPKPEQSQQSLVKKLLGKFSTITDALVFATNPGGLPGGGQGQPIQFVLQGNDLEQLAQVSQDFVIRARDLPELVNIDTNLKLNKPELTISVDRSQAGNLGVSVQDIARTLQILVGGQEITNFNQGNQRYEVVVRAEEKYRSNPEDLKQLYVRSQQGEMIALSNLVTISTATTPPQINHFNRFRSATLEGSPAQGVSLGVALNALENLAKDILPPEMRTSFSGESLEFKEAGQSTNFIFALALVFIFLTLAAQFESYIDPVIILLAVPLSLLGAFGALWIAQLELNAFSRIGLIMLIGLSTKNSILIVEFANQLREQGLSIQQAAIEACRLRFRPIMMTALSTILGVMPLAFATGAGAASRVAIGMAVMGGMFVSTFLSLYIIPVFYVIATSIQSRLMGHNSQRQNLENVAPNTDNGSHYNGNSHSNGKETVTSHRDHLTKSSQSSDQTQNL